MSKAGKRLIKSAKQMRAMVKAAKPPDGVEFGRAVYPIIAASNVFLSPRKKQV